MSDGRSGRAERSQATQRQAVALWVREFVLQSVQEASRKGAERSQLEELLADETPELAKSGSDLISSALEFLRRDGAIHSRSGRWFDPHSIGFMRGRLERSGVRRFRIRRLGVESRELYEVSASQLSGAAQGDIVLFEALATSDARARRRAQRAEERGALGLGSVVRVIERTAPDGWVGLLRERRRELEFLPFDHRLRFDARELRLERLRRDPRLGDVDLRLGVWIHLQPGMPKPQGRAHSGDSSGRRRAVRSFRLLGTPKTPNIETLVVSAHFGLPDTWDEDHETVVPLAEIKHQPSERARKDLRGLTTLTIDGESARDFDDALSIEELDGGGHRLWVHIADVSHYVRPGDSIDQEAQRRGTSVYFADRALHMLPASLSEDLCSLRPNVDRLALTVEMAFTDRGVRQRAKVYPSTIRSDARLTYGQVQQAFDGAPVDLGAGDEETKVRDALQRARVLAQRLLERRAERGTFEIEQGIGHFELDDSGRVRDYRSSPRSLSHRLIEEFMIQANVAVATIADERVGAAPNQQDASGRPPRTFLFRRHDSPKPLALAALQEQVEALGVSHPDGGLESLSDLRDLLASVADHPGRGLIETLVLRSLKRAVYDTANGGHFALGLDAYCHFTSPIRRYPDLVNHRWIKAVLCSDEHHEPTGGIVETPERLAALASDLERRAADAEREQFRWRMVRWLEHAVGREFSVTVSGVQPFGLFVLIDGYGIDGLIPFPDPDDARVDIEEGGVEVRVHHRGRRQRRRLGDSFQATLEAVDLDRRQVLFAFDQGGGSRRSGTTRDGRGRRRSGPERRGRRRGARRRGR